MGQAAAAHPAAALSPRSSSLRLRAVGPVAVRATLLGERRLAALSDDLESPRLRSDDPALDAAATRDRARARGALGVLLEDPWLVEAIELASPGLVHGLAAWRRDPEPPAAARAEAALLRYVSRAATRATPFGLMAGVANATVGSETALTLGDPGTRRQRLRLEANALEGLIEAALADPDVARGVELRPAPAVHRTTSGWRLCDARGSWSTLAASKPLAAVFELAAPGITWGDLARQLVSGTEDGSIARASEYVRELVERGVLVTGLRPAVTSAADPAHAVLDVLRGLPGAAALAADLEAVLDALDAAATAVPDPGLRAAAETAAAGLPGTSAAPTRIQAELRLRADPATLDEGVLADVVPALDLLRRLIPPQRDELVPFARAFRERYGEREVPLLEALDPELGVGLPPLEPNVSEGVRAEPSRDQHLALASLLRHPGAVEVDLGTPEVEALPRPPGSVPATLVALLAPLAYGRVSLQEARGPGARLLTRFACDNPELRAALGTLAEADAAAHPDALVADVVWDPETRTRNVVERPPAWPWEIEAAGRSGAPRERRLALSDLTLAVLGDGEIVLRSRTHASRVLPRWNTGPLVDQAPPPARFLGLLAARPPAAWIYGFQWDRALSALPYLPRVVCGPVVLAPRRWLLWAHELAPLVEARDDGARVRAARVLRAERGLPRHVRTGNSDRMVEFDLDNPLVLAALPPQFRTSERIALVESLPGAAGATGPDGPHRVELLVPLLVATDDPTGRAQQPAPRRAAAADELPSLAGPRAFAPGSEWLFASLYAGGVARDRLLRRVVAPLARELASAGVVDQWHVLRYADPDPHLRVRFHGEPGRLTGEALPGLHRALEEASVDRPWRVTVGTYVRELERYGGPEAIGHVERAFTADTDAVCELLSQSPAPNRFTAAVALDLDTMAAMLPEGPERLAALAALRDDVAERAGSTREEERQRAHEHRQHRAALEAFVEEPPAAVREVLVRRHTALRQVSEALEALEAAERLEAPRDAIATSLAHLTVHRLLVQPDLSDETWIHEMAVRTGRSRAARGLPLVPWAPAR